MGAQCCLLNTYTHNTLIIQTWWSKENYIHFCIQSIKIKNQHAITQKTLLSPFEKSVHKKRCLFMNVSVEHVNKTSSSTNGMYMVNICAVENSKVIHSAVHTLTVLKQWKIVWHVCIRAFQLCWNQPINIEIKPVSDIKVKSIIEIFKYITA